MTWPLETVMLLTSVPCLNRERTGKLKLGVEYKLFSSRA